MPTGTIIFWKETERGGFGFVEPDEAKGVREADVWFGIRALAGLSVMKGDRVKFEYSQFRHDKGPAAATVELIDEIETIGRRDA